MGTPAGVSEEEVLGLAGDRGLWRGMVECIFPLRSKNRRKRQTAVRMHYEEEDEVQQKPEKPVMLTTWDAPELLVCVEGV